MKRACSGSSCLRIIVVVVLAAFAASRAGAQQITLPPEARAALDKIYSGDPDAAVPLVRQLQLAQPDDPLGYLLEDETRWWKRYCAACEIKFGMIDSWKHGKEPGDEAYFEIADKAIELAKAHLAKSETAEMHLYAGMGWALKARVYALRGENRNVAHAGVNARAEMLRALELDPQMADATAALGIYNYYVGSLSTIVKMLRFFMGIPGGNKELGIKQMEAGMNQGVLLAVHVRFILARGLRQYDQKYEKALTVAEPLVARYPQNPIFLLFLGNLNAQLGRRSKASEFLQAALKSPVPDPVCAARVRANAQTLLDSVR
jgi:tetratricopeptide (TPR) repeat protein